MRNPSKMVMVEIHFLIDVVVLPIITQTTQKGPKPAQGLKH